MSLAYLAFAWLLGIAAAAFTGAGPAASLAAFGLLGAVSFARSPRPHTLVLILAGGVLIFAAGSRYDSTRPEVAPIARFNEGSPIRLRAVVSDDPAQHASYRVYRLDVRETFEKGRWRPDTGGILAYAPLFPQYEYGDLLEIKGRLEEPPEDVEGFDYREYLLRRGVVSIVSFPDTAQLDTGQGSPLRAALAGVRSRLTEAISDALPEPEASLAAGTLLGAGSALPPDLKEDMRATGTTHLVAVSGQNVVMLAALTVAVLAWLIGRRWAAWTALAAVMTYGFLVGMQPSVVRACIMGDIYILSVIAGRQNTAWVALLIAAAVMTAFDPQLVHDVSFQLSFAATLGLVLLATPLREHADALSSRLTAGLPFRRAVLELVTVTATAILFTLPITAINFDRISASAPVANIFAVPAFVAVAITAAIVAVADIVLPVDATLFGWIAWLPAAYTITVIQLFAQAGNPPAPPLGEFGILVAIPWYGALLALGLWLQRAPVPPATPPPFRTAGVHRRLAMPAAVAAVVALAAVFVWLIATAPPSGRLSVTFLDVGQGDAILVRDAGGHRILIDGGPGPEAIASALSRHLPFYDRRIDVVILTHPQDDHMGGLSAVLSDYRVGAVLAGPSTPDTAAYRAWTSALDTTGVQQIEAARGQHIALGDGATLDVLAPIPGETPADLNDASVVVKLTTGDISFLLTGDLGEEGEGTLMRHGTDLSATVLKVGHHGSRTSTSSRFLGRVQPLVDVISVGDTNHYGHPTTDVIDRLSGDLVLCTDVLGDITLSTDGERIWLETQMAPPKGEASGSEAAFLSAVHECGKTESE